MVSLRFPFPFPQRPGRRSAHLANSSSFRFSPAFAAATVATIASATAGIGVALAMSPNPSNDIGDLPYHNPCNSATSLSASITLSESSSTAVEPKTGVLFPTVVDGARRLLGIGLRKKNVFGLKSIDVYAFGVYAEVNDVKKLREKYGVLSESEVRGSKEFFTDVLDQDLRMTVRLQIVYGRLTIGSVRSAFEESVGNRLKKFSGSDNKELLKRFTSLFRDEYKLPRGSVIDLSREQGYILQTKRHDSNRCQPQAGEVGVSLEGSFVNEEDESLVLTGGIEEFARSSTDGCDHIESTDWDTERERKLLKVGMSWADMAQQDEFENKRKKNMDGLVEEEKVEVNPKKTILSREDRERIRFEGVRRKKDFVCLERIDRKVVNILKGLELHTGVFSSAEQKRIVDFVYNLQKKGRNNELGEYTYSEPRKWMRGKGRVTIQFGCCYNYAEKNGIPPGILRNVIADPIPSLFKLMIKRLIGWHVLPTYCIPDSCIVNIYEPGDCIPPHIDNHDFLRPFCTVSFLSECNILFGSNLKIAGPGEFIGSTSIPLPVGSVLVLNGNGADIAKHCVPAVPYKRISITFRKMDKTKWPHMFKLEPDLQNIKPFYLSEEIDSQQENTEKVPSIEIQKMRRNSTERLSRAKNKPLHFHEAKEVVERSSRHGMINDGASPSVGNEASNERIAQMQYRHVNGYRDVYDDSSFERQSRRGSKHPRERIRTT